MKRKKKDYEWGKVKCREKRVGLEVGKVKEREKGARGGEG